MERPVLLPFSGEGDVSRASKAEIGDLLTTRAAAAELGLSRFVLKSRIAAGVFPAPTRVSATGVSLFDRDWVGRARQAIDRDGTSRRRGHKRLGSARAGAKRRQVPTPERVLGFRPGTARRLPTWSEMVAYFEALAGASDRVAIEDLGATTRGNRFVTVTVSDPANLKPAARTRNRELLRRLWDPRGVSDAEAAEAIREGKSAAFVLATQHSNEIGAALMTLELAYELATGDDPATREILANTITTLIPSANPDGIGIIGDWYRRWLDTPYEGCDLPWLYHPYVGHDNNRDWFMLTQAENRLYAALHNREHPQLVFDMHQMDRDGARFMVPPFIDPLDPNQDPVIQQGFAAIGAAIAQRLTAAGKAGVATHIIFDNYSPSLAYGNYHGSIDLLSEAASCKVATPVTIDEEDLHADDGFDPKVRTWNHPLPWKGGEWTLAEIVEYDRLAARAFLEYAAKYREQLLRDYRAIARRTVERADPPSAFVLPIEQDDPVTCAELLQTLERGAVEIDEATAPIVGDGVVYPIGTRVVRLAQPAGNFAKTLLEVQRYPDLRQWPGGPPRPPYDIAGHTLPIQMGVRAVEVKDVLRGAEGRRGGGAEGRRGGGTEGQRGGGTEGRRDPSRAGFGAEGDDEAAPLRRVEGAPLPVGAVTGEGRFGWAFGPGLNAATTAISRLLERGYRVHRAPERVPGLGLPPGSALLPAAEGLDEAIRSLAAAAGVDVVGLDGPLAIETQEAARVRLGVYQSWRPSIDEGWARWVLEQAAMPYLTLHDGDVRQGGLTERFDAILLPHQESKDLIEGNPEKNRFKEPYPPEYVGGLGELGLKALQGFVEAGGTLIALDGAADPIVRRFALPARDVVGGLAETDFFCPGSLLRVVVDGAHPLGWGLRRETAILFMKSAAWETTSPVGDGEPVVVARYPSADLNLSGWLLGEQHLAGKAALLDVPFGEGRVVLVGFRPHFRGQARGTYKVLFNAVARAAARPARLEVG